MFYNLKEYWVKEINKAEKRIGKIERVKIDGEEFIDVDSLLCIIEELNYEIERTEDELRETKQDMEDNCIRRTPWEDSGMSYEDFLLREDK